MPAGNDRAVGRIGPLVRRHRVLLVLLALLLGGCWFPHGATERTALPGTYLVNGVDPMGTEYSGTLIVDSTDRPAVFRLEWIITGGVQDGTGTLTGDVLEATWRTLAGEHPGLSGTARLTVHDDGTMEGVRTIDGVDGEGTETVFPKP